VVAVRMWCMADGAPLRRIADSVVAAPPAGVRIRTRIHPIDVEAEALSVIGEFLGSVYRGELTRAGAVWVVWTGKGRRGGGLSVSAR
jgi:hypothetical protein